MNDTQLDAGSDAVSDAGSDSRRDIAIIRERLRWMRTVRGNGHIEWTEVLRAHIAMLCTVAETLECIECAPCEAWGRLIGASLALSTLGPRALFGLSYSRTLRVLQTNMQVMCSRRTVEPRWARGVLRLAMSMCDVMDSLCGLPHK